MCWRRGASHPVSRDSLRTLLHEESALIPKQVVSAVNLSKNNPFLPVGPGTSLLDVFKTLATKTEGNKSVHRVPVVDAEGRITKIISQSAAIQFLYAVSEPPGATMCACVSTSSHSD